MSLLDIVLPLWLSCMILDGLQPEFERLYYGVNTVSQGDPSDEEEGDKSCFEEDEDDAGDGDHLVESLEKWTLWKKASC